MRDVWQHALESVRGGHRTVLAVVTDHEGSVPGTTGAAMVLSPLGSAGTVGGGVAEHEVIDRFDGFDGRAEVIDVQHTPQGSGSLCSGRQTIATVRLARDDEGTLAEICDTLRSSRVGVLRVSGHGIHFAPGKTSPSRMTTSSSGWTFSTTLGLLDTLTIVGGGHCALALSRVMATLPFRIVVLDHRPELPTLLANEFAHETRTIDYRELREHVPAGDRSWVVVMTFGHAHDEAALRALIGHRIRYLGLLGSVAKVAQMFSAMRADGVSAAFLESISAPVGVSIGSHTPEEIAISIAAEIIRERSASSGR